MGKHIFFEHWGGSGDILTPVVEVVFVSTVEAVRVRMGKPGSAVQEFVPVCAVEEA